MILFIDYPENISSSPTNSPSEISSSASTIIHYDNSQNPFIIHEHEGPPSPIPSISSSVETTYPTEDPIFTDIYNHDLPWKNDYLTSQTWHAWKVLDHTLRTFRDQNIEIPNMINTAYNQLRDNIIEEYINRKGPENAPNLSSFIPFIHHAENANTANVTTPPNTPPE